MHTGMLFRERKKPEKFRKDKRSDERYEKFRKDKRSDER